MRNGNDCGCSAPVWQGDTGRAGIGEPKEEGRVGLMLVIEPGRAAFLFGCYFAPQFALLETAVSTKLLVISQCFSEFDTSARSEY